MTVIVRKRIFSLSKSKHVNSLPALSFSSSSLEELPSSISHLQNPHTSYSILSCLNQTGFSSSQTDQMIKKYPQTLKISPGILKAKLNVFHDNGFSTSDTFDIIYKHPYILKQCPKNRIRTSIVALKFVLGSTEAVCILLKKLSWFLSSNLDKTLIPNFEYLMNRSGLSCSEVAKHMISFPRTFLLRPETLAEGSRRVDEMGLKWTPKMYLRAVRVVCSLPPATLQLKKNNLLGLGFSDCEVLTIFNRYPTIFSCSEKKIKKTMEVLLNSGRIDSSSLAVEHTKLLLYSLEKRIKPRIKVVESLQERGLLPRKLGLYTILKMSNKTFLEKLVLSNLDALGSDIQKKVGKASPKILKVNLKIFHENGFSTLDTINIISKHPWIVNQCSENHIITSIATLKFVLGSTEAVNRILKKPYWFLNSDLDKTVIPNFEYLMDHNGLSCSEVANHMISFPMTFLLRPETLAEGVRRVNEMRLKWSPKMYLHAVGVTCSISPATLKLKKNIFFGFGFSDCEVLQIFNRYPRVFSSSERKIKETMEVLLSSGIIDRLSLAINNTNLLVYSLEKRIKPRLEVVDALEERGVSLKKLRLSTIIPMSNKKFLEIFVIPNSKALGRSFVTSITNKKGLKSCKLGNRLKYTKF